MPRRARDRSDLPGAAWALVAPLVRAPANDGCTLKHRARDLVDAMVVGGADGVRGAGAARGLRPGRRSASSVAGWHDAGVPRTLPTRCGQVRAAAGGTAEPTAGTSDAPSGRGVDTGGRRSRGDDAGKTGGRKRFRATDPRGLLLAVLVTPASVHGTAGGRRLRQVYFAGHRRRQQVTDRGFAGTLGRLGPRLLSMPVEVGRRPAGPPGFPVLPWRWGVPADAGVADGAPPAGRRRRTSPRPLRRRHLLGHDWHHDPPAGPRPTRHPPRTTPPPTHQRIDLKHVLRFEDLADRSERGENVDAEAARLCAMLHDVTDIYRDLAHRYEDALRLL